jgi:hypothetical protein
MEPPYSNQIPPDSNLNYGLERLFVWQTLQKRACSVKRFWPRETTDFLRAKEAAKSAAKTSASVAQFPKILRALVDLQCAYRCNRKPLNSLTYSVTRGRTARRT